MILFASTNRDADLENKCMETKRGRRGGMSWGIGIDMYTLLILSTKYTTNDKL